MLPLIASFKRAIAYRSQKEARWPSASGRSVVIGSLSARTPDEQAATSPACAIIYLRIEVGPEGALPVREAALSDTGLHTHPERDCPKEWIALKAVGPVRTRPLTLKSRSELRLRESNESSNTSRYTVGQLGGLGRCRTRTRTRCPRYDAQHAGQKRSDRNI